MLPTHITKRTTTRREEGENEQVAMEETPTRSNIPTRTRNKCDSAKIMTCIQYFLVFCLGLAINPHDIFTYFINDPTTINIHVDPPHTRTDPVIPKETQIVVVPTSPPTIANTCELITKPYPILKPVPGVCADPPGQTQYITAKQNPGGGFGHQTSNVLYGMLFAQACNFTFIFHDYHGHCEGWNAYSGFGSGCINYAKDVLAPNSPYQVIELPTPKLSQQDSSAPIPSCSALQLPPYQLENGKTKIVWKITDAATYHQCAPIPTLRQWFWSGRIRQHPDKNEVWSCYILAAHIRRGDTKGMKGRYLSLQVYQDVLPKAHAIMSQSGYTRIHIFSDGKNDEIQPLLDVLPDAKLMRGTVYQDWEGMVRADVFMHAKSSFSHQAGLLGDNIKLSPSFWHYTQCDERWIHVQVDEVGEEKQVASFDEAKFREQWEKYVKYRKETERPVYG